MSLILKLVYDKLLQKESYINFLISLVTMSSESNSTQTILFWIFYLVNIPIVIIVCLNSARLKSINPYAKKIVFLLLFSIYYITGKTIFKDVHTLIATALPLLTMYIIDIVLGKVVIVGLTGGIASGKSTLVNHLKEHHKMKVIDCDEISKRLRLPGQNGYKFILQNFGEQYIDPISKLVRSDKLGELAFKDEKARRLLTSGTGKFIFIEMAKQLVKNIVSGNKLMLVDAPILFQTKILQYFCFPIIVVWIEQEEQIKRLSTRNGYSKQQSLQRIKSQMPTNLKIKKATIAVKNQESPDVMFRKVEKQLQKYIQK